MAYAWCGLYGCWANEAEDITEGMGACDYECNGCEESEEVAQGCR